jgi:hypothetical protein
MGCCPLARPLHRFKLVARTNYRTVVDRGVIGTGRTGSSLLRTTVYVEEKAPFVGIGAAYGAYALVPQHCHLLLATY